MFTSIAQFATKLGTLDTLNTEVKIPTRVGLKLSRSVLYPLPPKIVIILVIYYSKYIAIKSAKKVET